MPNVARHVILSDRPVREALAALREEVSRLSETVADRELELSELRSALACFETRYFRAIGSRYVQLDALRARIAELRAEREAVDEDVIRESWYRRFRAERSAGEYDAYRQAERENRTAAEEKEEQHSSDEEIKKLYRTIAVQIHPDRAEDETAAVGRTALMAELNAAYARGDAERMRSILEEWLACPEAVSGFTPEAEVERLSRTASRLKRRIGELDTELERLALSEMVRLMRRVEEAADRDRDLLKDLAAELDRKIEVARRELEELEAADR